MNDVIIPRVDMAVKSIAGASREGPNSVVQNPDRRVFTGNTGNTPPRSASSRSYKMIGQDEIDEIRKVVISEDGDFLATRLN